MDTADLILGVVFGALGAGYFIYGKKRGRWVTLGAGVALCVVPYFFDNWIAALAVCSLIAALPWFIKE